MRKSPLILLLTACLAALAVAALHHRTQTPSTPPTPASSAPADLPAANTTWPSFRGDPQLTGNAPSSLPEKLRQLWKITIPDDGFESTAAIAQDRLFIGTQKGHVLALKLNDGSQLWQFTAKDSVSASPCIAEGKVFVGDEEGVFYALDAGTGKELWHVKTHDKIMSSAVVVGKKVLFGSYDRRLRCLDVDTGNQLWEFRTDAQVHCSPAISPANGGEAVIAGCDKTLHIINLNTGEEEKAANLADACAASPALFDGNAYVGNLRGDILAVSLTTGNQLWKIPGDDPADPLGSISASAAVTSHSVFIAAETNKLLALDRSTGKIQWTFEARSGIESSPVLVDGSPPRLFFGSADGNLYALDAANGKPLWQFTAGGSIKASPAIAQNRLLIGSTDGTLYCFGQQNP